MDTKGVGEAVENVMLPVTLFIVRVLGGISMKGRTVLYNQDNGTLTAMGYQDEILDPPLSNPMLVQSVQGSSWCTTMTACMWREYAGSWRN